MNEHNIIVSFDHLVSLWVPAHLEDAASSLVRVHQLAILGAPDVDTPEMKILWATSSGIYWQTWSLIVNTRYFSVFYAILVKTAAGEELPIRRERHTVHWFLVPVDEEQLLADNFYHFFTRSLYAHLVSLWTLVPRSTSHKRTVESKEALARTRFMFGLLVPVMTYMCIL